MLGAQLHKQRSQTTPPVLVNPSLSASLLASFSKISQQCDSQQSSQSCCEALQTNACHVCCSNMSSHVALIVCNSQPQDCKMVGAVYDLNTGPCVINISNHCKELHTYLLSTSCLLQPACCSVPAASCLCALAEADPYG